MTSIAGTLFQEPGALPYHANVVSFSDLDKNRISYLYKTFLSNINYSTTSLVNRSFPSLTLNPDFNILSANGLSPVTPAQGSDYELLKQWFVVDGGASYTMTPTPYATVPPFGTGSKHYLNVNIPTIGGGVYLYNLNYSLTDQFYTASQLSDQDVTFSAVIKNNTNVAQKIRFSAYCNNLGTNIQGGGVFLQPDAYNLIATTLRIPQIRGQSVGAGNYVQFRLNFENNYGSTFDSDIYYLKAELSNVASPLQVNHVLESIICNNLV